MSRGTALSAITCSVAGCEAHPYRYAKAPILSRRLAAASGADVARPFDRATLAKTLPCQLRPYVGLLRIF